MFNHHQKEQLYLYEIIYCHASDPDELVKQIDKIASDDNISVRKLSDEVQLRVEGSDLTRKSNFKNWLLAVIKDILSTKGQLLMKVERGVCVQSWELRELYGFKDKDDGYVLLQYVIDFIVQAVPDKNNLDLQSMIVHLIDSAVRFINANNRELTFAELSFLITRSKTVRADLNLEIPFEDLQKKARDSMKEWNRLIDEIESIPETPEEAAAMKKAAEEAEFADEFSELIESEKE